MNNYLTTNTIKHTLANLNLLTFEVTDACNLKCKYCGYGEFYEDYDERKNQYLSTDYAKAVIDFLVPYWNSPLNTSVQKRVYVGFYGGEPLLNMPFIEAVIDYILNLKLDKQIVFEFSMTTNALLLERYMDFIVKHKFNTLISLDGNRENTAYRVDNGGQPAFDRIIKNVNALRNAYPDYFDKYVNFNSVLHNKNSVESIYTYIKDEYDKIPAISELNNMGIRPEKRDLFERTYKDYQESISSSENYRDIERGMFIKSGTYQTVSTFLQQYSGFVFKDYTDLLLDEKEGKRRPTGTCSPFSKKMFITVNGKILPCERIGQQFALGTVDNNGVHLDLDSIAEKYNNYFSKLEKQCSYCKQCKSCVQCIFNLENIDNKPVCTNFMNETDFENYVREQVHFLAQNPEEYYRIMEEVIIE
ncbi:MAG: radical SAM peptide maturase [Bacteroidales bacterium]|jgi:uncharacterized protein|nr:radical SAM peptide maturase [Bacteroidales bacterium]